MLGIPDADSGEHDSGSKNIVITPVSCAVPNRAPDAPKLSGAGQVRLEDGSLLRAIYDASTVDEEYFCNYEVNPEYEGKLEAAGLRVTARGSDGRSPGGRDSRTPLFPGDTFSATTFVDTRSAASSFSRVSSRGVTIPV